MFGPFSTVSVAALLPWLAEVAIEATLLLAVAFAAAGLLRGRSAAVRHLIWTAALAAVVALPVIDAVVPSRVHVSDIAPDFVAARFTGTRTAPPPLSLDPVVDGASEVAAPGSDPSSSPASPGSTGAGVPEAERAAGAAATATPFAIAAVLVWLFGALGMCGYIVWSTLAFARAAARGRPLDDGFVERALGESHRFLAGRPARLRESASVRVPLSAGVVRPMILLPQGATDWPRDRLRSVLVHELAHVRRRDAATHFVARVACALFWFNPLVWWAARRLRGESERACDDAVLAAGTRPSTYAAHLFEIAHAAVGERGPVPGLAMARPSEFEGRILDVLAAGRQREGAGRPAIVAAVTAVGVAVLALAFVSLGESAAEARPSSSSARTTVSATSAGRLAGDPARDDGRRDAVRHRADASERKRGAGIRADDDDVERALIELLGDLEPSVRGAAARALGERSVVAAVPHLIRSLEDPHDAVRARATYALTRIEDARAIPALRERLLHDDDGDVRKLAAAAIGETEVADAVTALASALEAIDEPRLRAHTVRAIGETRQPSAVPVLERLLFGDDDKLRKPAAEALATIGSADASSVLLRALKSEDARVRKLVARALGDG